MHNPRFPTIPSYHQPHRQNTIHGFSCKRSRNTSRHCNRAMWHAAISVVADCRALTFNFLQRYCIFLTKQFGGKQLFNFHDCGCRGTTALQLNGTISPLDCGAVTLRQPQNKTTNQLRLFFISYERCVPEQISIGCNGISTSNTERLKA